MSDPTLHLLAFWEAAPGRERELEEILLGLVAPSRAEPGCLRYDLYCATDGSGRFTFVEEWADEAAFRAHGQAEHLRIARERGAGLVAALSRVEMVRKVA